MATAIKKARSPHQPTGQWIRSDRRLAIYLRDSFRCVYCCADLHAADPRDITLDHLVCEADSVPNPKGQGRVIPKSGLSIHHESNLVTACRSCNCSRQDKPLNRFAGAETRADIRRLTKRSLKPYLQLAKGLISGETGFEETLKQCGK